MSPVASRQQKALVPPPDLDDQTALEMVLADKTVAVQRILENASTGVPV
jgi:hypothetical protein